VRPSWKTKKAQQTHVFVIKQTSLDGFVLRSRGLHRRADQDYGTNYVTKSASRPRICNYCSEPIQYQLRVIWRRFPVLPNTP
jgi:hypothetical protein